MRFSDEEYLTDWRDKGVFPKIHQDIFTLFSTTFESDSVLDLCCCTGLLGQHIKEAYGITVVGAEGDPKWIERGRQFGVNIPTLEVFIKRSTLKAFVDWIKSHEVTGIIARRCISELFGNKEDGYTMLTEPDWQFAKQFTEAIVGAGVKELWLEGRADQGRSVHPIPDTETEIRCFTPLFTLQDTYRKCAYLTT